jgi:DeoR/GlpR family transcriptional regulator of sugar metabolism
MERSDELIVLADHTKLGNTTFAQICEMHKVSAIISDWNYPKNWNGIFLEQNVTLLIGEKDKRS